MSEAGRDAAVMGLPHPLRVVAASGRVLDLFEMALLDTETQALVAERFKDPDWPTGAILTELLTGSGHRGFKRVTAALASDPRIGELAGGKFYPARRKAPSFRAGM